jgi:TetR/AcrR family transcriptional regulator
LATDTVRKNTKRLKGPERKHQIAEAMLALADTFGIHGVTTAKIAAHVGVSESALYMHFQSRDMMLREAIDLLYEQELATMSDTSGAEDVVEHFLRMSSLFTTGSVLSRSLRVKLQLLASPLSPELRERVLLGEVKRIDAHIDLVERGKAEGSIRADLDSRQLVWDLYDAYSTEGIPAAMIGLRHELQSDRDNQLVHLLKTVATDPSTIERYLDRLERERVAR